MFEKWNGGNANRTHTFSDSSIATSGYTTFSGRHKFLELDVNEVKPSDIVKSVLAKKSIFDDDLKRLENIGEKYEPKEFSNLPRANTTATCKTPNTPLTLPLTKSRSLSHPTHQAKDESVSIMFAQYLHSLLVESGRRRFGFFKRNLAFFIVVSLSLISSAN